MQINAHHIAKLANLPLTVDEEKKFEKQLSAILEHIEKLSEVTVASIEETSQVTGLTNVTRADTKQTSLPQIQTTTNAKKTHNDMFAVPIILEEAVEE